MENLEIKNKLSKVSLLLKAHSNGFKYDIAIIHVDDKREMLYLNRN